MCLLGRGWEEGEGGWERGAGRAEHLHQIFWARSLASPHLKGLVLQPFLFFF